MLSQEMQSYRTNHTADSAKLCAFCRTQLVDWMVKAAHSTELQLEDATLHLAGAVTCYTATTRQAWEAMHCCMRATRELLDDHYWCKGCRQGRKTVCQPYVTGV